MALKDWRKTVLKNEVRYKNKKNEVVRIYKSRNSSNYIVEFGSQIRSYPTKQKAINSVLRAINK